MFDTQVTLVGNLVADPRLYYTNDGQPMASFRLASTPRRFNRGSGEWRDGDTLWVNVTCWRGLAENVATSLKKGQAAIVMGRLSARLYETKDGDKRQSIDVDAMAVGPELSRVVTVVKRAERGTPPGLALVETPSGEPGETSETAATAALAAGETEAAWDSLAAPEPGEVDPDFPDDGEPGEPGAVGDAGAAGNSDDSHDSDDSVGEAPELVGAGGRRKPRFGLG